MVEIVIAANDAIADWIIFLREEFEVNDDDDDDGDGDGDDKDVDKDVDTYKFFEASNESSCAPRG